MSLVVFAFDASKEATLIVVNCFNIFFHIGNSEILFTCDIFLNIFFDPIFSIWLSYLDIDTLLY